MSTLSPVVVYETKPATEWILGGPVQKVSPRRTHSMLQGELGTLIRSWARGRGDVGPEWRFWLQPPGEQSRYLVPDMAYISYERLPRNVRGEASEEPHVAPEAVFEILSPDDRPGHVAHKIDVYLSAGTLLVSIIDPAKRTIRNVDSDGERTLTDADTFEHPALPGFTFDVAAFFEAAA